MDEVAGSTPLANDTSALQHALTEHSRRDRLIVQRGIFASTSPKVPQDMYVTSDDAAAVVARRESVTVSQGGVADTNTYFGRFAASFWQRWTAVAAVHLTVAYATEGNAEIVLNASDSKGRERMITAVPVSGVGETTIEGKIEHFVDGGAMWFEVRAMSGDITVSAVTWTVPAPEIIRPAAVVICTFNRADDCVRTVGALASDAGAVAEIDAVCVVDQGTDRVDSREGFADVTASLGSKLIYLRQANLGGAGGFSRGMHEIMSAPNAEHTNVILMDDDILCEPESVLRMNAFANMTVKPAIIGAQMLSLNNPTRLHVSAEREVLDEIKAGSLTPNAMMGVDLVKKKQEARFDAGWNGWWTCLVPGEIIAELGLPIPLFFQWDDIEYGIRARYAGHPTVTLPNAGVWHADFYLKDYDDWSRYFSIRNGLIVSAVYGQFDGTVISKYMLKKVGELIVGMQYGLAATFIKAMEHFLEGPAILHDGGQSALAEIRALRDKYPETKMVAASEAGAGADPHTEMTMWEFEPKKNREGVVLLKRVVQQWTGRVNPRSVTVPAHSAEWWHVSLFQNAAVTDASQNGVRLRRRDKMVALELGKQLARVCWELRSRAPEMKQVYTDALPELVSAKNWTRLYDAPM